MKIAVLGLGAMGRRMAANLIEDGHEVTVWNRTANAAEGLGAAVAPSPADAVAGVDIAMAMLRDDEASASVWIDQGALNALPTTAVAVESSTLSPVHVAHLSDQFAKAGKRFVDAPVLGSRGQAESRTLIHVVGGAPEDAEAIRPLLSSTGAAAHHMGPAGAGAAMKLIVNGLLGIQIAALAELLGACRQLGLDRQRVADVLAETAVTSPATRGALGAMKEGTHAPAFPVELIEKDFGYLIEAGDVLPISSEVQSVFQRALTQRLGALNMTAVERLYR